MSPGLRGGCCLWLWGLRRVLHVCVRPSPVTQTPNLAEANAAEEDKIKAMMIQSCRYYEPLK